MRRAYADSPYGQLHFVTAGTGQPVLLLPPAKRSSRVHADLIPLLANRYRVLSVDYFGFGRSDPLPDGASIEILAEGVRCCLDAIGVERAHVYGLHTGNKIGAALAARWPERVSKFVFAGHTHSLIPDNARRNAVIGKLVGEFLTPEVATDSDRVQLEAWAALYRRIGAVWWDGGLFHDGAAKGRTEVARRIVLDYLESADSNTALYKANFSFDLESTLRALRLPTLILEIATPDEDRDYGRQAEAVQRLVSGSTIATLYEATGHAHTLEGRSVELAGVLTGFFG